MFIFVEWRMFFVNREGPNPMTGSTSTLGELLAREAVQRTGGQGEILVIMLEEELAEQLNQDTIFKAFLDEAHKQAPDQLVKSVRIGTPDDLFTGDLPGLYQSSYNAIQDQWDAAKMVVSLVGPPHFARKKNGSMVITLAQYANDVAQLLVDQEVDAVVLPQPYVVMTPPKHETAEERAARFFRVITRDTLGGLEDYGI